MTVQRAQQLDALIDGAEELLTKLADAHNPQIQRLRDRVDHAIGDARRAIERESHSSTNQLRDIATTLDDYVRDYPWLAVLTGIFVAGSVGFIAGSTAATRQRGDRLLR